MNLAFRLRPQTLSEFLGQSHLVGQGKIIRSMIEQEQLFSLLFWGPPGTGKTTLAHIIAKESHADFHILSAVTAGKDDLKKVIAIALENEKAKKKTILFIDEIHRWNKAQQDTLLPHVESGLIILIGATTENPSFEINNALLSRSRVFVFHPLGKEELEELIQKALKDSTNGLGKYKKTISPDGKDTLLFLSGGDARALLNALEVAATQYKQKEITREIMEEIFQKKSINLYDKNGEEHYNTISAFIKSLRGSDADAALYYLIRMLENGEDPLFIARRLIIFASEDVGMADRGALIQANGAYESVRKIGMPECQLTLSYATIYLAKAPKSRLVANALEKAKELYQEFPNEPIPLHLRNAPTKLMKELNYGENYTWGEKYVGPTENESFLPEKIKHKKIVES
jgi:putative ATPase